MEIEEKGKLKRNNEEEGVRRRNKDEKEKI